MIPMTFAQWLGVNRKHGRIVNGVTLGTFYRTYVKPEHERLAEAAPVPFWNAAEDIEERFKQAGKAGQYPQAQALLDQLVVLINDLCRQLGEGTLLAHPVKRYTTADGWQTEEEAVEAMDGLARMDARQPRPALGRTVPAIPGIKWSTAKQHLPQGLVNLIRDIRNASRIGGFVDERNQQQRDGLSITPNAPATLRSWHMNDQGALPPIPGPIQQGPLHNYYRATSQPPGNSAQPATEPTGYAEYTGCGIQSDRHSVKLVLEYTNNEVYVTVSHYKRWTKDNRVPPRYTVISKTEGENSAWFYIDFTS